MGQLYVCLGLMLPLVGTHLDYHCFFLPDEDSAAMSLFMHADFSFS